MIRHLFSLHGAHRSAKAIIEQVELLLSQQDWQAPIGSEGVMSDVKISVLLTLSNPPPDLSARINRGGSPEKLALELIVDDIQGRLDQGAYALYGNVVMEKGTELRRLQRHASQLYLIRGYRRPDS